MWDTREASFLKKPMFKKAKNLLTSQNSSVIGMSLLEVIINFND